MGKPCVFNSLIMMERVLDMYLLNGFRNEVVSKPGSHLSPCEHHREDGCMK